MYKLILTLSFISLFACSTPQIRMENIAKGPKGISVINITNKERAKAYRAAEKHCAKYYKVPRILNSVKQKPVEEFHIERHTTNFECLKPSN